VTLNHDIERRNGGYFALQFTLNALDFKANYVKLSFSPAWEREGRGNWKEKKGKGKERKGRKEKNPLK